MEYILALTIIALLGERFLSERNHAKEREDLIRGLLSKDAKEYSESKIAENTPEVEEKQPDLTPIEELDDQQFMKAIHGQKSE